MPDNYTIKESFTLPSKGLIYSNPINPVIELRSMTTREELRRNSPSSTTYKALADIIQSCIVGDKPSISVYDMCIGDYEFLLHKLRIITYGQEYKMLTSCPLCGAIHTETLDLDKIPVKEYDDKKVKDMMTVKLDRTGKVVVLKVQTPRILDSIQTKVAELAKKSKEYDYTILVTLEEMIDTVDGQKLSFGDLESFINNLPAKDMNKLMQRIDKLNREVGLETKVSCHCDQCGYDFDTFFRFQPEFFRPAED